MELYCSSTWARRWQTLLQQVRRVEVERVYQATGGYGLVPGRSQRGRHRRKYDREDGRRDGDDLQRGRYFLHPARTRRVGERRCPHGRIRGERTEQGQRRSRRREFSLGGPGLTPSPTSHPAQHSLHPSRGREPAHGRPRRSRARAGRFPRRGPASKKKLKKKEYAAVASVLRWVSRTTSPPPHLSSLIKRGQPQRLNLLAPLKVPQRVALEPERAMETRRARVL